MKNVLLGLILSLAFGDGLAFAEYALISKEVRSESRDILAEYLSNLRAHPPTTQKEAQATEIDVVTLIESYRLNKDDHSPSIRIADAPYLGYMLAQKGQEIYDAGYDSEFNRIVNELPVDILFDAFMGLIGDGQLNGEFIPKDVKEAGQQIGKCMAKRILKASKPSCELSADPENIKKPGFFQKVGVGWAKYVDCHLPWIDLMPACTLRKIVYNMAKPQLVKSLKDPEIRVQLQKAISEKLPEKFPVQFRAGFLDKLSLVQRQLPQLVTQKFNGDPKKLSDLWGKRAYVAETDDQKDRLTLHGFAAGLRADIGSAAVLARSANPAYRGMAGALFYAAANRLIVLTGGNQAKWDGKKFLVEKKDKFEPANPRKAPLFTLDAFGGWGVDAGQSDYTFTPWDWITYNPTGDQPTAFRLFPSSFVVGKRGMAQLEGNQDRPIEMLEDLADLVVGVNDFLKSTRADGPLGPFFGEDKDLGDALLPDKPLLFPRAGRQFAIGLAAGVLKNIVGVGLGHAEQVPVATEGAPLGLRFHDLVTFEGRDSKPVSVRTLSKLLVSIADLGETLRAEPVDVPPELMAQLPQLDAAVQAGALTIGNDGLDADAGARELLMSPLGTGRSLMTAVYALSAMTRAFDFGRPLIIRLYLKGMWNFLDRYWVGGGDFPSQIEGNPVTRLSTTHLLKILTLWDQTQVSARAELASEINWDMWEQRFNLLRVRLQQRVRAQTAGTIFNL